jgi:predicted NUDIX family NTP pyrophosphohydrolase
MAKQSAGIILYRPRASGGPEVLLVHPGGPYWAAKDLGAWSIPKGEFSSDGEPLAAARREFTEETGYAVPSGDVVALGAFELPSRKIVHAWAIRGDVNPAQLRSNTFSVEWPPRSGTRCEFPEVDRAEWFDLGEARRRITPGQRPMLEVLEREFERRRTSRGEPEQT